MTLDLEALRRLAADGRTWRSVEDLAGGPEAKAWLENEFPRFAPLLKADRRKAMKLMGAVMGMAGLTSCGEPREEILPYVNMPEGLVPGTPMYFASALPLGGIGRGVVVESREGRPVKIEGNPDHPMSLGGSDAFLQAELLTLYDPDRAGAVLRQGQPSSWDTFLGELVPAMARHAARGGEGLAILTEGVTSPTLERQIETLRRGMPKLGWHRWQPIPPDNAYAGAKLAFGRIVQPFWRFDQARVVLALDADFLGADPAMPRFAHDFAALRRVRREGTAMGRLYVVEPTMSLTGANADARLALRGDGVEAFARALARRLGIEAPGPDLSGAQGRFLDAAVQDLRDAGGGALVVPGLTRPPAVHALAHAINERLGAVGRTVDYLPPVEAEPVEHVASLRSLVGAIAAGEVETLIVVEANPVYDAPADLDFAAALDEVPFKVRLGLYADETSKRCGWHLPATHPLEGWSDVRGLDGTAAIVQPLVRPLWQGRTAHELLAYLSGEADPSARGIVRARWRDAFAGSDEDFEAYWRAALQRGVVAGTGAAPLDVRVRGDLALPPMQPVDAQGLELHVRPDPAVWDGRYANNAWLQELPRPLTKQVWGNALLVAPSTAADLGLKDGDQALLKADGRDVRVVALLQPGQAAGTLVLNLGYGRTRAGAIGDTLGVSAYPFRRADALWTIQGVEAAYAGTPEAGPPRTQHHHAMQGREIVREATLEEFLRDPNFVLGEDDAPPDTTSLYPKWPYPGHAWGMSIDQTACIGCNACVIACQAENNIPVVGPDEVERGREMHWLRIDRYYKGGPDAPEVLFQPVPCMHCEKAPCEPVCPVAAPVHDHEGLNVQVYNRCVGTRFCQSNCPYKVRRFNFFGYSEGHAYANQGEPSIQAARNPEVTVRGRGVMEKCTYCVQRIQRARIDAEREGRALADGEIVTACQQACPTSAIVFGDLNQEDSEVVRLKAEPHDYGLLVELGTRPRTTYLARIRNPNAALNDAPNDDGEGKA